MTLWTESSEMYATTLRLIYRYNNKLPASCTATTTTSRHVYRYMYKTNLRFIYRYNNNPSLLTTSLRVQLQQQAFTLCTGITTTFQLVCMYNNNLTPFVHVEQQPLTLSTGTKTTLNLMYRYINNPSSYVQAHQQPFTLCTATPTTLHLMYRYKTTLRLMYR